MCNCIGIHIGLQEEGGKRTKSRRERERHSDLISIKNDAISTFVLKRTTQERNYKPLDYFISRNVRTGDEAEECEEHEGQNINLIIYIYMR